jgi:hypothetical protein
MALTISTEDSSNKDDPISTPYNFKNVNAMAPPMMISST